jgi:hypothetical protein
VIGMLVVAQDMNDENRIIVTKEQPGANGKLPNGTKGYIVDTNEKKAVSPPFNIYSLLLRGSWRELDGDAEPWLTKYPWLYGAIK